MSDIIPVSVSDTAIFAERGYTFNRLLGEGSYAKVWLVNYSLRDQEGGPVKECSLACKIIDSKKAPRDFINRFLPREMDVLTKISHPHLIHLHSIYQRKTKFFIFMRYAEKGDLLDHILANGEVREKQARLWTRQLALGLQYLHNLEIVHRDIKCENVLITANNNVKLADFGFARFMVDSAGKRYLSSTYCGSLAYAAPELLKGKPYDPKNSDVWSLGIVLYVMLNQCMPFNDNDMNKLYELQVNSKWTFRSKISQMISEEVKSMVHSMLIPDSLQRIIIDDVVNHRWFSCDDRLKVMSPREREALEVGLSNKSELIPKNTRMSVPSWKKRKKDEQIVCVTSLRFERSSNQFQFETRQTSSPHHRDSKFESKKPEVKKSEDRYRRVDDKSRREVAEAAAVAKSIVEEKPLVGEKSKSRDSVIALKPKATTSSVALLDEEYKESHGVQKRNARSNASTERTDKVGEGSQFIQAKPAERITDIEPNETMPQEVIENKLDDDTDSSDEKIVGERKNAEEQKI